MKTRCGNCRKLTDYGRRYCPDCESKISSRRKKDLSDRVRKAEPYTKSATWQSLRKQIILRDNGCCRLCFSRGIIEYRQLQVHHIVKRIDNLNLAYEPTNLVTVCRTCHEEVEKLTPTEQRELFGITEFKTGEELDYLL